MHKNYLCKYFLDSPFDWIIVATLSLFLGVTLVSLWLKKIFECFLLITRFRIKLDLFFIFYLFCFHFMFTSSLCFLKNKEASCGFR